MKCPNCGSMLTLQEGRFCPYCGTDLGNDVYIHIKNENVNKTEIIDHGRIAEAASDLGKSKAWVALKISGLIVIVIVLVSLFSIIGRNNAAREQKNANDNAIKLAELNAYNKEMERLQAIEDEILQDIREEKYEQAIAKAKTLVYTGTYNSSSRKAWDEKRQELINTLAELIKREEANKK